MAKGPSAERRAKERQASRESKKSEPQHETLGQQPAPSKPGKRHAAIEFLAAFIGSAILALFCTLVIAALAVGGVINMPLVEVLLGLGWIVASGGMLLSLVLLADPPRTLKGTIACAGVIVVSLSLWWLDGWIERNGPNEAGSRSALADAVFNKIAPLFSKQIPSSAPQPQPVTPQSTKNGIIASVRSGLVSTGVETCGGVMTLFGGRTIKEPVVLTPIVYLLWLRLISELDYRTVVDSYSMDISEHASGPWARTMLIPLDRGTVYTRHPSPTRKPDGTYEQDNRLAIQSTFASLPHGGPISFGRGIYLLPTSTEGDCAAKVDLIKMATIDEALVHGIESHGIMAGWAAFNPPQSMRTGDRATTKMFYRLNIHTGTEDFKSYGDFSTPGHLHAEVDSDQAIITKENIANGPMSFADRQLFYVGPSQ